MDKRRRTLLLGFMTIFIDMMGFGAAFPILPVLFSPDADWFSHLRADRLGVYYGLLQASFAIAQFLGAPMLGALSDRYGRRPILMASLVGASIGYAVFAYGVMTQDLTWMFIGRIVPGFTGGNIAIVYAAMADNRQGRDKVADFGIAGAAFGLGMIMGPVLGGLLSDASIAPVFGFHVPFIGMSMLSALNLVLVVAAFPETIPERSNKAVNPLSGFQNLRDAFRHPTLKRVFWAILLHASGFSLFIQFVAFVLEERYAMDQLDIGIIFGYVGLLTACTQAFLVRPLSSRIPSERLVANVMPGFALGIILVMVPEAPWWLYLTLPLPTIFQGLYMPNMTAVVSNLSDRKIQGRMLSINQSLTAASNAIPPLFGGWLLLLDVRMPVLVAVLLSLCGWGVYNLFFQRYRKGAFEGHSPEAKLADSAESRAGASKDRAAEEVG